ncbi:phosphoadenosine phosphosulfate reductase domain-containing protein [Intestinibacillus massiliensis]|uniref:phosphoadenosine phosphosulfate reductase domain-containing protein n=1 Tax=Intestinibacillus massiliensis TaxID=1871029 RepID=UPI000B35FDFD|nr:phosphoadenosine phosphosulfate reductase family protein [Intestinibacillus massiliensis]
MVTAEKLKEMQGYSPEFKHHLSVSKIYQACLKTGYKIAVSFSGGKDSTVLLDITARVWSKTRKDHGDIPLPVVYANTSNEFSGMEVFVRQYCAYIGHKHGIGIDLHVVRGEQTYYDVLRTEGYPVASKKTARKVREVRSWLQESGVRWDDIKGRLKDGIQSANMLRAMGAPDTIVLDLTGIKSDNKVSTYNKLALKWRPLITAPFKVSEKCCDILKKAPIKIIERELGLSPVIAEMASDSETRKQSYLKTGCNAFKGNHVKSKPMGFWLEQDVLWYIDRYKLPTAPMYGDLVRQADGTLKFSGEQRTGCKLCLFGCQFDPERLERLKGMEPQTIDFALRGLEQGGLGYREVVEYINENCKCKMKI